MGLNFADIFETVVAAVPDETALVVRASGGDECRLTFAALDARANQLAHVLAALGIGEGDHVGCHLYDGNQYIETTLAAFKLRAVPVNVNFRYVDEELTYLFDNADLKAVVTEPDLEERATLAAATLAWPCPVIVADDRYEQALAAQPTTVPDVGDRSPDDRYGLWTGGTTGMPKGVVWRHEDIYLSRGRGRRQPRARHRAGGGPRRCHGPGREGHAHPGHADAVPPDARRRMVARVLGDPLRHVRRW